MICLSGDTHYGEISRLDDNVPYPLWDITSSGLTEVWHFQERLDQYYYSWAVKADAWIPKIMGVDFRVLGLRLTHRPRAVAGSLHRRRCPCAFRR